jgi:hypothetical protein
VTVYTFSEARQRFAAVLERARREGAVRVKRRDGQMFLIQPERSRRSPLDVEGINTDLTADEIVRIVRDMRQRVGRSRRANRAGKRPGAAGIRSARIRSGPGRSAKALGRP